ncbi:MAG TPA: ComEC/Rec2 family competence protein, partial [Candidatus Eisenbacteria bacterium]|nr:ComEC/Rec2 family competence protein [Candidatus Eisenbacteria bacterium]
EEWRRTGTAHYLALSGLHIGLIAVPLFGILTLAGARGVLRDLAAIFVLSFYAAVAGRPGSLLRALSMISVLRVSRLAGIRTGPGNCVLAGAFLVCIFDPFSLSDMGFLLSFNAAAGVALLGVPACRWFQRRLARVRGSRLVRIPLVAVLMSVCVQAAMLPLSVRLFGSAPLAGPLLSVVMALPVTLLLYGGFVYVLAGHLLPFIAVPVLNIISDLASGIVSAGARLPAACLLMRDFDAGLYITGLLIIAAVSRVPVRKMALLSAGLSLSLLSFMPLFSGSWKANDREIRFPASSAVLYGGDGGVLVLERRISSRTESFLSREVRLKGVRRLKTVIILRPGGRFASCGSTLVREFAPESIMISPWDTAETSAGPVPVPVKHDTLMEARGIRLSVKAPKVLPGRGCRAGREEAALCISPLD